MQMFFKKLQRATHLSLHRFNGNIEYFSDLAIFQIIKSVHAKNGAAFHRQRLNRSCDGLVEFRIRRLLFRRISDGV